MAYYETINLVANDTKPYIDIVLRDSNKPLPGINLDPDDPTTWHPIDLTGVTVKVHFRAIGTKEILDTLDCVKHAPYKDGKCFMVWNPETLAVKAGTYEGEVFLEYEDGNTLTIFDRLKFKVREDF